MSELAVVFQAPGSLQCGQACVAMVLGVPLHVAVGIVGHGGPTRARDLIAAIGRFGRSLDAGRFQQYRGASSFPPRYVPPRCLLATRWGRDRHWMLWWDGSLYDPLLGRDHPAHRGLGTLYKITGYVRIGRAVALRVA